MADDKTSKAAEIEAKLKKADQDDEGMAKLLAALEGLGTLIGDTNKRLDAMEAASGGGNTVADPTSPEQRTLQLTEAQARADAVAMQFGAMAPRPMDGETVHAYRCRLLQPYLRHSKEFESLDLRKVAPEGFAGIEQRVYADAVVAARNPKVPEGTLMEIKRPDGRGHIVHSFYGSPSNWMSQFAGSRRFVNTIKTTGW